MIHVAVLLRPYAELILSGEKTVECRLTKHQRPPYNGVESGDRIYFKESAGPWRLTAVADEVLFEDDLTPGRIREIRRDYNDLIRGDGRYWKWKRDARYLTLIWLREVEPVTTGPGVRPLQGAAWLTLPDAGAPRSGPASRGRMNGDNTHRARPLPGDGSTRATAALSFAIPITEGNLRHSSLSVCAAIDQFPAWCLGGPNRREEARPVTLILRDGPVVRTDIVVKRKLFRARPWGRWFRAVGARPGDRVVFTPIDGETFFVGFSRSTSGSKAAT